MQFIFSQTGELFFSNIARYAHAARKRTQKPPSPSGDGVAFQSIINFPTTAME